MALLEVQQLNLRFGGIHVLKDVSFTIEEGEVFSIIGPNGAGKTSMINCITGLYKPQSGSIIFGGKNITHTAPHKRAKLGISRTFQNIELFKNISVLNNLMLGRHVFMKSGVFSGGIYWGFAQKEEVQNRYAVERIIDFLEIQPIRDIPVGQLAYGLQKRVELGRALAMEPKLLLLDEPMAGMNNEEKKDMVRFILDIHEQFGTTIVLIEHDIRVVMELSHRIAVFDFGELIACEAPERVQQNQQVIQAYLGQE